MRSLLLVALALAACRTSLGELECDASRACEPSGDPCAEAYCAAEGRCQTRAVVDGTACGGATLSDCRTARVCVAGACTDVAETECAKCALATPCRDAGVCRAGRCDQPPTHTHATPRWERAPVTPGALITGLATDENGDLYWQECATPWDCSEGHVFSVDAAGRMRFHLPVRGGGVVAVVDGRLVRTGGCYSDDHLGPRDGFLESRALADGALFWSLDLAPIVPPATGKSCRSVAGDVIGDGAGTLFTVVGNAPSTTYQGLAMPVALDAATGAVKWSRRYDGWWAWAGHNEVVANEAHELFFRTGDGSVALAPDGTERTKLPYLDFLHAARGGRVWGVELVTGDGKMHFVYPAWDEVSGKRLFELQARQIRAMPLVPPLFVDREGYAFDAGNDYTPGESLVGFDPSTGKTTWSRLLALAGHGAAASSVLSTPRGSLIFVQGEFAICDDTHCEWTSAHLREMTTRGEPTWSCEIPVAQFSVGANRLASVAPTSGTLVVAGADGVVRGYAVE